MCNKLQNFILGLRWSYKELFLVKKDEFIELIKLFSKILSNKFKKHHIKNVGMSRFYKILLYLK